MINTTYVWGDVAATSALTNQCEQQLKNCSRYITLVTMKNMYSTYALHDFNQANDPNLISIHREHKLPGWQHSF